MNDKTISNLKIIQDKIASLNLSSKKPTIICVSKTFSMDKLKPLINFGHLHFGENKVQEAEQKWIDIIKIKKELKIHMVGKLQRNKAKKAVMIFDFIHTLDNQKLADTLSKAENEINKKNSYFIQVNIGNETQKSGITAKDSKDFLKYCLEEAKLKVIGLMVIPPNDQNTEKYFKEVSDLNSILGLKDLSMGMSSDYEKAIEFKTTFLRIGSAILGPRVFNK